MKPGLFLCALLSCLYSPGQTGKDTAQHLSKIVLVPYQSMMYFSDDDPDLARFSKMDERQVRSAMRNNVEANIYHQLLSDFDVVSLMRATSLNGEEDLKHIYAATRYTPYSRHQKEAYQKDQGIVDKAAARSLLNRFSLKSKKQTFWISDSSVMLGMIEDQDLFKQLARKHNNNYVLFVTQFEMNTSNKNSIEWLKQEYEREYTLHYNLFDTGGKLLRAETLTIKAGNENNVNDINSKYLVVLAQQLKEIIIATDK